MNPLRWLIGALKGEAALDVGLAEIGNGVRYPVRAYSERVSPDLVRGSRPDGREAALVAEYGIKTAISLCAEPCRVSWPEGVSALNIPIVDNTAPTVAQVRQFLWFTAPRFAPVYVHCEAGQGRTSVMVAAYRMAVQGWTAERAIQEARQHGMCLDVQEQFLRGWRP